MNLEHRFARRPVARRLLRSATAWFFVAAIGITACSNEEASWEVSASSVGAETGDEERFGEHWRDYRVGAMATLDLMEESLENASRGASVADREELMTLRARIDDLRERMLAEFDAPGSQTMALRKNLEASYDGLRADIEALLVRLGHSRDEFARWREPS